MSKRQVLLLLGGVALILIAIVLLLCQGGDDRPTASALGENRCPDCGRTLPKASGGVCPFCKLLRVAEGKPADKEVHTVWTATDYFLIGMVLFLFAGGGYLIARSVKRVIPKRLVSGPIYLYRCPWCKRKMRFTERQAGNEGVCPNCKHALVLPYI
jgi:DNA-directed RNA polymerase subunit RPC12/RpoP